MLVIFLRFVPEAVLIRVKDFVSDRSLACLPFKVFYFVKEVESECVQELCLV